MANTRFAAALFAVIALIAVNPVQAQDTDTDHDTQFAKFMTGAYPAPHSKFCVLIDVNSGKVLYALNPHKRRPPASTTKMLTAILLLERGKLDDTVTVPPKMGQVQESSLHLKPNERIPLEDLLYAMLLRSANDTPVAGAYYLDGSVKKFVEDMNAKAREIGCKDSHFVTPNGLYAPGHYSTAYDLALIGRYAVTHLPEFNEIVKTRRKVICRSIDKSDTLVKNTADTFLKVFPGADGIKTGYIHQAGHCFVGSATQRGWRLMAVALNSSTCRSDVMQMLSYGFANFQPAIVTPKDQVVGSITLDGLVSPVPVHPLVDLTDVRSDKLADSPPPAYTTLLKPDSERKSGDVHPGDAVGTVVLLADGRPIMTTDAIAVSQVAAGFSFHTAKAALASSLPRLGKMMAKGLGVAAVAAAALIAGLSLYGRTLTKNSRRRRPRVAKAVRAVDR